MPPITSNEQQHTSVGHFKPERLEMLRQIVQQDYGVSLSDEEAEHLGFSLLKVTRLAMGAFNRAEEARPIAHQL